MEIGSVKLCDADRAVGKAEVTELCTMKESIIHKIVDMSKEMNKSDKFGEDQIEN